MATHNKPTNDDDMMDVWLHVKLMSAASEAELVSRCTVGLRVGFALPQAVKVVPSAGMVGSGGI